MKKASVPSSVKDFVKYNTSMDRFLFMSIDVKHIKPSQQNTSLTDCDIFKGMDIPVIEKDGKKVFIGVEDSHNPPVFIKNPTKRFCHKCHTESDNDKTSCDSCGMEFDDGKMQCPMCKRFFE